MKLIFCPKCGDVLSLRYSFRSCTCSASGGKYLSDGYHAVIEGDAIPLGFNNDAFKKALAKDRSLPQRGILFTAFVIPEAAETVKRRAREVRS